MTTYLRDDPGLLAFDLVVFVLLLLQVYAAVRYGSRKHLDRMLEGRTSNRVIVYQVALAWFAAGLLCARCYFVWAL